MEKARAGPTKKQKRGSKRRARARVQPVRDLNNGTMDVVQNLTNASSTTFQPELFTDTPSQEPIVTKQSSVLSSNSLRAAYGMNM